MRGRGWIAMTALIAVFYDTYAVTASSTTSALLYGFFGLVFTVIACSAWWLSFLNVSVERR